MKKAILIICALSLLALLVVSVAAEVVSLSKGLDGQADPGPVSPERYQWSRGRVGLAYVVGYIPFCQDLTCTVHRRETGGAGRNPVERWLFQAGAEGLGAPP